MMKLLGLLSGALLGQAAFAFAGKIQKRCGEEGDTFKNPVIYSDFPDNDIFRGPDGSYYFSASNFHYSPGAPILRSDDLVNWDIIGHSIPRMTFGDGYDLPLDGSAHAYRGGTWASTMRYRESNGLWYWVGCTNFWVSWVFTAPEPTGPWSNRGAVEWNGTCYYDNGLLIDDDDTMCELCESASLVMILGVLGGLAVLRQSIEKSGTNRTVLTPRQTSSSAPTTSAWRKCPRMASSRCACRAS
jgi:glycosyl hydrolase family 43